MNRLTEKDTLDMFIQGSLFDALRILFFVFLLYFQYHSLSQICSRIITNAEEIAFYGGHDVEKANLQRAYKSLAKQSVTIFNKKLGYVMLEQFLMKYGWAGTGMITMAIPIFTSREDSASVGDNIAGKAFEMVTS